MTTSRWPLISILLAVYNKAPALPATLASLQQQVRSSTPFELEFVLVDDASTDDSVAVASQWLSERGLLFQIQQAAANQGPARCLNQAASMARGDWLFVFDADDIAPQNVIARLLDEALAEQLDFVYARSQRSDKDVQTLMQSTMAESARQVVSAKPVVLVLQEHIVHPVVLVKCACYARAGGAHPDIFIQDEPLALRLAMVATRAGLVDAPGRYVVNGQWSRLSSQEAQQHHDQFQLAAWALAQPALSSYRRVFAGKAMSAYRKSCRRQAGRDVLGWYLLSRLLPVWVWQRLRASMTNYFERLPGVRRFAVSNSVEHGN